MGSIEDQYILTAMKSKDIFDLLYHLRNDGNQCDQVKK